MLFQFQYKVFQIQLWLSSTGEFCPAATFCLTFSAGKLSQMGEHHYTVKLPIAF